MKNKAKVLAAIQNMWMPRIGGFSGHDEILIQLNRAFVPADSRKVRGCLKWL